MRWLSIALPLTFGLMVLPSGPVSADEVLFLNGDRLTGKILSANGGKLTIKTDGAGDVAVDLAKVKTFSTDESVRIGIGEKAVVQSRVDAGADRQVQATLPPAASPQPLPIPDIKAINWPPLTWTGSISLNGLLTTGNSETEQLGFRAGLSKRWPDDRLTLGAEYSFGRQEDPDTGEDTTTIDYGMAFAKYDHFFSKKLYGYLVTKAERDGVADLELRLAPGAGVGYQWLEGATLSFSTEAGLAWVYENFKRSRTREFFGPRLAYSLDWTPLQRLTLFHKLEYLPSFEDLSGDYLLNVDAGTRVTMWKGVFAELRYEFRYDSTPAPGREKADTRYILGAGWAF